MTAKQLVMAEYPEAYAHDVFGDRKMWWMCTGKSDPNCRCGFPGGCPWPQTLGESYRSAKEAWNRVADAIRESKESK
jgi:hypothetical protein